MRPTPLAALAAALLGAVLLSTVLLAACATPQSSSEAARNLQSTQHQPAD